MKKIYAFVLMFAFCLIAASSSCYAAIPSELPSINTITDYAYSIDEYVLVNKDGSYDLYLFSDYKEKRDEGYEFTMLWNNSIPQMQLRIPNSSTRSNFYYGYYQYSSTTNSWSRQGSGETGFLGMGNTKTSQFVDSTLDLYDADGNIFFTPPPVTLEGIVAEEVTKAKQEIIQTMMTILLCGVGCLALLISLVLFGKVFYRYQVK